MVSISISSYDFLQAEKTPLTERLKNHLYSVISEAPRMFYSPFEGPLPP